MKGGAFGFSRKEIIWFAVIFFSSLTILIFCASRIVSKYYHYSENAHMKIKGFTNDLWNLQEITLYAVNTQRSSLNLLIYAGNRKEMENIKSSILKNRDSIANELIQLNKYESLDEATRDKIKDAGKTYVGANKEFLGLVNDSAKAKSAADFNVNTMRPALRNLTDLSRQTGKTITGDIQKITEDRLIIFSLWEFWGLIIVLLPYLYFLYRFLHLFIKILVLE